ncbi:hypothetical protein MHYP_G00252520 [Metynnis hypsauchen]
MSPGADVAVETVSQRPAAVGGRATLGAAGAGPILMMILMEHNGSQKTAARFLLGFMLIKNEQLRSRCLSALEERQALPSPFLPQRFKLPPVAHANEDENERVTVAIGSAGDIKTKIKNSAHANEVFRGSRGCKFSGMTGGYCCSDAAAYRSERRRARRLALAAHFQGKALNVEDSCSPRNPC